MLSVLIVDDHAIVRHGLRQMLAAEFRNSAFGEARDAREALAQISSQSWGLILLDITLPDQNGLALLKEIRERAPGARVLVFSIHTDYHYALRAYRAGASGYVSKDMPAAELLRAVRKVALGGKYVSPAFAEKVVANLDAPGPPPHQALSAREQAVLIGLASGNRICDLAEKLQLNVKTVSTYRRRVLEKMGLKTNAELTRYAIDHGLI